jgi:hypothetical protein
LAWDKEAYELVTLDLPALNETTTAQVFALEPLFGSIDPTQSTARVLSTKVRWRLFAQCHVEH